MVDTATTQANRDALWQDILLREIKADGRGKAGVAARMGGIGRAYVSRAVATIEGRSSGFAKGVPKEFIDRVLDLESQIDCPATPGHKRPRADCHKGNGPAPTHNPLAMNVWRECQRCPQKPAKEVQP